MPDEAVVSIPDSLPVMVLGGATLFPHGYMPLFIFEERYREMLRYALRHDRMFCVGHTLPGIDAENHADPVYPVTTAGLVRACVTHDDGTSHLMLSGMHRVEIQGWEQRTPFRIAKIAPLACRISDPEAVARLALEVVDLCGRLCEKGEPVSERLRQHLGCVKDPSAIADVVAQSFLSDPCERQRVLEMLDVCDRLDFVSEFLSVKLAGGA
ncbi:MAG: LON peptidase substrate-binding domain-containing protein [Verrucomicrobiales bacterium]